MADNKTLINSFKQLRNDIKTWVTNNINNINNKINNNSNSINNLNNALNAKVQFSNDNDGGFRVVAFSKRTFNATTVIDVVTEYISTALIKFGANISFNGNIYAANIVDGYIMGNTWGNADGTINSACAFLISDTGKIYRYYKKVYEAAVIEELMPTLDTNILLNYMRKDGGFANINPVSDLNNFHTGMGTFSGDILNMPTVDWYFVTAAGDSSTNVQRAYNLWNGQVVYQRHCAGGVWSGWGNAFNHAHDYLPLSGGNITGAINVGSAYIGTDGNIYMPWSGCWLSDLINSKASLGANINMNTVHFGADTNAIPAIYHENDRIIFRFTHSNGYIDYINSKDIITGYVDGTTLYLNTH